jgi:hypothetical protein
VAIKNTVLPYVKITTPTNNPVINPVDQWPVINPVDNTSSSQEF